MDMFFHGCESFQMDVFFKRKCFFLKEEMFLFKEEMFLFLKKETFLFKEGNVSF